MADTIICRGTFGTGGRTGLVEARCNVNGQDFVFPVGKVVDVPENVLAILKPRYGWQPEVPPTDQPEAQPIVPPADQPGEGATDEEAVKATDD